MFLQVNGIGKQLGGQWVLKNIHFTQERFRKLAVAGETGSGKSTMLKIIAGLEHPDEGVAFFEGQKVKSPYDVLLPGQPGIAYLSQHFELRANYYVEELLSYANRLSDEEARALFAVCRIDHLLKRKVDQLSGGEKQRIALARLLVGSPRLLLLDEPFSNLDPIHKEILKAVLQEIGERLQLTCLLTSHDPMDTLSWAEEIIVMKSGRMVQRGTPERVYYQPADTYVAGLFGRYNLLPQAPARLLGRDLGVEGKRLFVRSEQLTAIPRAGGAAMVERVHFNGMFHQLEVSWERFTFFVQTTAAGFTRGQRVDLSLAPGYTAHTLP